MSQINQKRAVAPQPKTHEGGDAVRQDAYAQLRRSVLNCLLWEDTFYESGVAIADRIKSLVAKVDATRVHNLAIEARDEFGLRHVPLLLAREMVRGSAEQRALVASTIAAIVRRPDEIAELMSLYWSTNDGKKFVAHSVRRGIGLAMGKFSTFQLAKWDRKDREVRIRDAMFMSHVKPSDLPKPHSKWSKAERKADRKAGERAWPFTERETVQFQVAQDLLTQTGTWEDRMSAGESAKAVFEDLMSKRELGGMAFVRNVRKMTEAGIDSKVVREYSKTAKLWGMFPHQLITAARHNPAFSDMFDEMLVRMSAGVAKLAGKTAILIDVSGSMDAVMSKPGNLKTQAVRRGKAASGTRAVVEDTTRIDAASAVAIMARELCEEVRIFTFSHQTVEVANYRGMALRDAIHKSQAHGGTWLQKANNEVNQRYKYDRIIVITDEQSQDGSGLPLAGSKGYILNVAPYQNSVAVKDRWHSISGWSPHVLRYVAQIEAETEPALAD